MRKTKEQLTPEQLIVNKMQRLMAYEGREFIVDKLKTDLIRLEGQLKRESTRIRTPEQIIDINYIGNKIELMEDMILMPNKIIQEYQPIIQTNSPDM